MKNFKLSILVLSLLACENEDETPEVIEEEETQTEAIDSWVIVNADSFFVAKAQALPGGSPYRYQINFATREQLTQTNNDGQVESTFAIQLAFTNRPSASGTYSFTNDRFNIEDNELSLYQSWFINTGHPNEDKNFLSETGSTVDFTIENGKLRSGLESHILFREGDDTETLTLKWQFELGW